jgi:putative flippase GtrA
VNLFVLKVAVDFYGLHYLAGKLISVAATFSLNFGLRRAFLFSAPSRRRHVSTRESRIK